MSWVSGATNIDRQVTCSFEVRRKKMTGKPSQLRRLSGNDDVFEAKKGSLQDNGVRCLKSEEIAQSEYFTYANGSRPKYLTTMFVIPTLC